MSQKKKARRADAAGRENLRLSPEQRLAPAFDAVSVKKFPIADAKQMGMRVKDNCAEENIK